MCTVTFSVFPMEEHLLSQVLIQKGVGRATSGCMTVKLRRALGTDFHLPLLNFLRRLSLSENPKRVPPCFHLCKLGQSWAIFFNASPNTYYQAQLWEGRKRFTGQLGGETHHLLGWWPGSSLCRVSSSLNLPGKSHILGFLSVEQVLTVSSDSCEDNCAPSWWGET